MKNWKTEELGGLVKAGGGRIQTGPFGSQLHAADYVDEGIPCIMPTNMENNRVRLDGIARITEADAQRLKRHIVKTGDIVYSRRGDVTQKALIHPTEDGYFCGTGCLLLRPGDKIDPTFLTYYLSTKTYQNWIVSQAVGGTMPNLNTGILERVSFTAPDKDTQQKIAKVLATLDAKIALNNRINAELEAMAKLLYDYWFVQFDFPMTAAQATALGQPQLKGQPYKSSGGRMVFNSTLKREIPEEWEARRLKSIAPVLTGREDANHSTPNGKYPFFTCGDRPLKCDDYKFEGKAILLAGNGNFGIKFYEGKFNAYQRTYVLIPASEDHFGIMWFAVQNSVQALTHGSSGSIIKFLRKGDIEDIIIPLPKEQGVVDFEAINRILLQILNNQKQNQELTTLRNWLLPMLMNGQATVKG